MSKDVGKEEEKLIDLVRDRPCLHDKAHPDYKNTVKKESQWTEIAGTLQNMTGAEAKAKWTALRSQYKAFTRRLSKPSGSEGGRRAYFRHEAAMGFLKGSSEENDTTSTNLDNFGLDKDKDKGDIEFCVHDVEFMPEDSVPVPQIVPRSKEIPPGRSHEKFGGKKRKVDPFDKEILEMLKSGEDEFESFGKMITPKLRKLSEVNRKLFLKLQYDINSLIHNAELASLE